jgi:hypothetical protein
MFAKLSIMCLVLVALLSLVDARPATFLAVTEVEGLMKDETLFSATSGSGSGSAIMSSSSTMSSSSSVEEVAATSSNVCDMCVGVDYDDFWGWGDDSSSDDFWGDDFWGSDDSSSSSSSTEFFSTSSLSSAELAWCSANCNGQGPSAVVGISTAASVFVSAAMLLN